MSSAKVWAEFNAYDFESDPRWAEVKRQIENGVLEFPTGLSEKDALERMKYRFYKKNVDSTFDPSKPIREEAPEVPPQQTYRAPPSTAPRSSSQPSYSQEPQTAPRFVGAWLFAQTFIILSCLLYAVTFGSSGHYYRALYAALISYGLNLYSAFGSTRQFNRELLARVLMNDNLHYFVLYAALCFARPSFDTLIPLVLYSVLHLSNFIISPSVTIPAKYMDLYRSKVQPTLTQVVQSQPAILMQAATVELYSGILAFVSCLFGGGIMLPLAYYWFLNLRYTYNHNTRMVLENFFTKLDSIIDGPYCPSIINTGYHWVKRTLNRQR